MFVYETAELRVTLDVPINLLTTIFYVRVVYTACIRA